MIYNNKFRHKKHDVKVSKYDQEKTKDFFQSSFKFKNQKKKKLVVDQNQQAVHDPLSLASPEEFCLLNFRKTKNNTHCTISRLFGIQKTLTSISGGAISSTGKSKTKSRRKTRYAQRMIFKFAYEKLLGFGFKYLVIHCSGPTHSKRYIYKNFYKRFKIIIIKDFTPRPHNGCRASKLRRV